MMDFTGPLRSFVHPLREDFVAGLVEAHRVADAAHPVDGMK
jgi:hypothetical protein